MKLGRFAEWALGMVLAALLGAAPAAAQLGGMDAGGSIPPPDQLVRASAAPLTLAAGGRGEAVVTLEVASGWHINANPPSPDYMIPTVVRIAAPAGIKAGQPAYPAGEAFKVGFDDNPLSVYGGTVVVRVPLQAARNVSDGERPLRGSITFQACNDHVCTPPATVAFDLALTVTGGSGETAPVLSATDTSGVAPERAPPDSASAGLATFAGSGAPPARPSAVENPLARALERGGLAAFFTLFLIGLALNLTPCVYPMLGVTVSIFGARRAAPPAQVFGLALLYVLGMAMMYSALGLIAAFTGGLFGGFLQNPLVLVGIGLLLAALSLSMFGLYDINLPPALLTRLGGSGTTSAAGVFLSGLVVGIFAAPCIGPPVVALLAIVGAKADPWFGFSSFFTLALGLGFPYLLLGTFSNLLQTLPRSGEWMVWVKKVFGVVLLGVGAFYVSLALAPGLSGWVLPVTLVLGGVYLGFFEKSAASRPRFRMFKIATGTLAALGGIAIIATTPSRGIAFEAYSPAAVEASLRAGKVVMLDFSADWCVPCHELERGTFSDPRVIDRSRAFAAYKVDLTRYDSPDAERWRRQYGITGVPTVVFLVPEGREVFEARVEGFIPPDAFLERMDTAEQAVQRAG